MGLAEKQIRLANVHNAEKTEWTVFEPDAPDFRFVPRNAKYEKEWNKGWSIREAFVVSGKWNQNRTRSAFRFTFRRKEIQTAVNDFRTLADDELRQKIST